MTMTNRNEAAPQKLAPGSQGLPPRAFILNCFGRGGSNIVWNMIASSPDVLIPSREWHQGVFGKHTRLRKTVRALARHMDMSGLPSFAGFVARQTAKTIPPEAWAEKPNATATVLKVMGYHIVFAPVIEAGFAECHHVVLTRHPLPMCESLIRSGETEARAATIYNDIAANMAGMAEGRNMAMMRFEELIADPAEFYRQLTAALDLAPSPDGLIRFMQKKYGAARTTSDHGGREVVRLAPEELRERIDANVNRDGVTRLTPQQRNLLWQATREKARALGYGETDY